MSYSSVYGNKIRKLWKLLAKNDMLTSTAYDFSNPQKCKVKDCDFKSNTAMETFRHIRENHLTEIKKLNIKIGKPLEPLKMKAFRRPGPKSRTRIGYKKADDVSAKTSEVNNPLNQSSEEMDFESAINSIQQISENSET